jgi:ubiquitin-conjugating enzyme E2 D/E
MFNKMSKRLYSEFKQITDIDKDVFVICPTEHSIYIWEGYVVGPKLTPYEGGKFYISITFPPDYPYNPPLIMFKTQIYHPNINESGTICLDILKDEWSPILTISKVMYSLSSLLAEPNPDDPLIETIAIELKTDKELFINKARYYTETFAKMEYT